VPKAIRIHKTGGPEALEWEDIPVGDPGEGQARVRQTAIGVNFVDTYQRSGLYPVPWAGSGKPAYPVWTRFSVSNEGRELEDGIPVATRAARAQRSFNESVRQLRGTNSRRVDHIKLLAVRANRLWTFDCRLKGSHTFRVGRFLQEHDEEMAGVALGLLRERIARDNRFPLHRGASEIIHRDPKPFLGLDFQ
jgi:hypothetical protein